ncbi:MAG TPA: DUF5703 domain-containing protein, partial [Puia sp.]|nr:DUF5703 domain-containing protein [Puia sp.]
MKTILLLFVFVPVFVSAQLDHYDVSWDTPGPNSAASMPLGNGDIGLNVWVDPGGDLLFYISKTDAWGQENDPGADPWLKQGGLLMKLGLVRVHVDDAQMSPFRQTLHLADGEIRVREGALSYRVWVDANHPVIRVEVSSPKPVDATVTLHDWRLGAGDTILDTRRDRVTWVHRNLPTDDPHVAGICFGAAIEGRGMMRRDDSTLAGRGSKQEIAIHALTVDGGKETVMHGNWLRQLDRQIAATDRVGLEAARAAHRQWWKQFWERSYIYLHGDAAADSVTRGYLLQRFVTACAGRGAYPIKFNGSIFVVDAGKRNADYRGWGGQYWFQNTRPMYWPRLAAGDFDLMMPLFKMYLGMLPGNEALVRKYYGHGGAYFQETSPFWGGLPFMGPGEKALYTHHYFTPILELSMMMLDYYEYTKDAGFLKKYLLPVAGAGLEFFDRHFPRDSAGRLLLDPDNSIEMYWKVHDPAPDIAGLHAVLPRMLGLPVDASLKARWRKLLAILPPLPVDSGRGEKGGPVDPGTGEKGGPVDPASGEPRLLPYTGPQTAKAHNEENPELYAIYPFRLYGLGKPDLELARHSFDIRKCPQKGCWSQDPVEAAMLGYADLAKTDVAYSLTRKDPGSKFPAFWAKGHDYNPDEDNGGNGELGLQKMLLQTDGKTIRLLPAWPAGWDADFKLHAPYRTTVEGKVRHGRLVELVVTPAERRKDVVVSGLTRYVDPMIGSGGHGHVFVGASVPFGAVQAGPQNIPKGWDWCSGYHYSDSLLIGFSQLHLSGTGIGDLGDVLVMPYTGAVNGKPRSFFSHRNERCRPGYYSVHLDDYDIDVQLTASERVAFHRYSFPDGEPAHILIDLKDGINDRATDTHIEKVDEHTIEGYRFSTGWAKDQRTYFAIRCD